MRHALACVAPENASISLCCSIFPSPEQNPGLCHYQGLLNTGGSLPDLSNLHFPSPLSTPLDPEDNGVYPNLSGGSSTGNLPAAMMHLGIGSSQGGQGTALCSRSVKVAHFTSVFVSNPASLHAFATLSSPKETCLRQQRFQHLQALLTSFQKSFARTRDTHLLVPQQRA